MKLLKSIIIILISLTLAGCSANVLNSDAIKETIEENGLSLIVYGEDSSGMNNYSNIKFVYDDEQLPSSYDLREKGLVTSIKNQGSLGTCWVHALMAAAETAVLKNEGLTVDEYVAKYGVEPDFAEKAFNYYACVTENGVTEGNVLIDNSEIGIYSGGNTMFAIASLLNGYGLYDEEEFPYYNQKGHVDYWGVWTLDEANRYDTNYTVDAINILPSPNGRDENGEYVFNQDAVNQIKKELCNNNAVVVAYHADNTVAEKTYDEVKEILWDELINDYHLTEEKAEFYIQYRSNLIDLSTLSEDELKELIIFKLKLNNFDPNTYDVSTMSKDDMVVLLGSEYFGKNTLDDVLNYERNKVVYINNKGENRSFAHYTYDELAANHVVVIVGYDDNYSASNFNEGHYPPGDGAFICKNSWADSWGDEGYLYLSYYDKTIDEPNTVEVSKKTKDYSVLTNSKAQFNDVCSTYYKDKVFEANILDIDETTEIFSLGIVTDNLDTEVTYQIYQLNDEYKNPTDGKLLATISEEYKYSGLHRLYLDENITVEKGKISVVTLQKANNQYVFVNSLAYSFEYILDLIDGVMPIEHDVSKEPSRYTIVDVPDGTSYYSLNGKDWVDWSTTVDELKEESDIINYLSLDNLPVYVYTLN